MPLRIITRKRLEMFGTEHADAQTALADWDLKVRSASWTSLAQTRRVFASADEVKVGSGRPVTVFNIKGNRYRLIVAIHYDRQLVYVLRFLTHAEYSKDMWKDQL
jgi:mRNA interferase HigB